MSRIRCVGLALCVLVCLPTAAGPIEAPLELLTSSSSVLIAAKLLHTQSDGHIVLKRTETLSGTQSQADRITLRLTPDEAVGLKDGARYVAGYTIYIRDPRDRKHKLANPDGPALLRSPGLEPALFADTRLLRAILREGHESEVRDEAHGQHGENGGDHASSKLVSLLLKALKSSDTQLQNLAANEFAYDPAVADHLDERARPLLHEFVVNPGKLPAARSALLQAAFHNPETFGDWWVSAAQNTVTTTPIGGYIGPTAGLDGLAMAAFSMLGARKTHVATTSLVRWVAGESPALSERALMMLRQQSPATERSAIKQALAEPDLPAQTRKFLTEHLRRLDLLQARVQQPH